MLHIYLAGSSHSPVMLQIGCALNRLSEIWSWLKVIDVELNSSQVRILDKNIQQIALNVKVKIIFDAYKRMIKLLLFI